MKEILEEIVAERLSQNAKIPVGFDDGNSQEDWVAYICAYAGRAPGKVFRNQREGQTFRGNMIKVAALAVAAIEAYDEGLC